MRKVLFWTHLTCGSIVAVVVLIISLTGVLLMYERQMIEWADRHYRSRAGGLTLSPEALLMNVQAQTGSLPDVLMLRSDPAAPAEATVGTTVFFVDANSGRVLGEGSKGIRQFFRSVTNWHRWLALEGPARQVGRAVTGAANVVFFGLALTGMYLWLPRRRDWKNVRAVLLFRGGLSGKARDFNWHNVIGIWSAIPLLCVIAGALVISYPWATNAVYRLAGSEPPAPNTSAQKGPAPVAPHGNSGGPAQRRRTDLTGLDRAWVQAQAAVPGWQTITWRSSAGPRISLAVAESHRGRVDLRSSVVVDRNSGVIIEHENFSRYSRGRQWRMWLRFIHTGEALGLAGQSVAGLVSAGAVVLVWTGLALTLRRFRAWTARRKTRNVEVATSV